MINVVREICNRKKAVALRSVRGQPHAEFGRYTLL